MITIRTLSERKEWANAAKWMRKLPFTHSLGDDEPVLAHSQPLLPISDVNCFLRRRVASPDVTSRESSGYCKFAYANSGRQRRRRNRRRLTSSRNGSATVKSELGSKSVRSYYKYVGWIAHLFADVIHETKRITVKYKVLHLLISFGGVMPSLAPNVPLCTGGTLRCHTQDILPGWLSRSCSIKGPFRECTETIDPSATFVHFSSVC